METLAASRFFPQNRRIHLDDTALPKSRRFVSFFEMIFKINCRRWFRMRSFDFNLAGGGWLACDWKVSNSSSVSFGSIDNFSNLYSVFYSTKVNNYPVAMCISGMSTRFEQYQD
jgi:hypothetical protein